MKNKILFFVFTLFLLVNSLIAAAADDVEVQTLLDKQDCSVGEELHLNIKVVGARGSIQPPQLPPLDNFDLFYSGRSSRFSFVNGQTESMTEFNYVLIPRNEGQYVIQPIKINVNGKEYSSDRLNINVTGGSQSASSQPSASPAPMLPRYPSLPAQGQRTQQAPVAQQPSYQTQSAAPAPQGGGDSNIFLRVMPSKIDIFTNEQLLLTYSLFTRYDTRYEGFVEEPETSGFWVEEFPMDQNVGRDTEMVGGKKYVRADVRKMALFPTASGEYVIKPGMVKASVQLQDQGSSMFDEFFSDSFFSGSGIFARRVEKQLTAPEIKITVNPLPEAGKPQNFKGAVGNFRMTTDVDKRTVGQNEALTLKVSIEGDGNIETVGAPEIPKIEDVKTYESDTKTEFFKSRDVISGKKVFEMIVIPSRDGELVIPSLEFSFFNPRLGRYVTLKSEPYKIRVTPSSTPPPVVPQAIAESTMNEEKKGIKLESEDIRYIRESVSRNQSGERGDPVFWLALVDIVLTLAWFLVLFVQRRSDFLDHNVSLKRNLYARKFARDGFSRLKKLEARVDRGPAELEAFFVEYAKVLNQYIADKLNLSSFGLTQDMVVEELLKRNVETETIELIRYCYSVCDRVRFGRIVQSEDQPREMVERLDAIIKRTARL